MRVSERKNKPKKSWWRRGVKAFAALVLLGLVGLWLANVFVISRVRDGVFHALPEIPKAEVGLVLGTSPYYRDGSPNGYFESRMDAAAALYFGGAVQRLVLSGDHREDNYNEPRFMEDALLARGVPESALTKDGSGLNTRASLHGAKRDFPTSKITVISQEFHLYRALFYAEHLDLDARAYCARDVTGSPSVRLMVREWLARAKAIVDAIAFSENSG